MAKVKTKKVQKKKEVKKVAPNTKTGLYIEMLKRKEGATIEEMAQAAVKELGADFVKSLATARTQVSGHLPKRFVIKKEGKPTAYEIVKTL